MSAAQVAAVVLAAHPLAKRPAAAATKRKKKNTGAWEITEVTRAAA